MGRQKYKFKKGDNVIISFPQEILQQAKENADNGRRWLRILVSGSEQGNQYAEHIASRDILQYEGGEAVITSRRFAKYVVKRENSFYKISLPHTCMEFPSDEQEWWRAVRNERLEKFTVTS